MGWSELIYHKFLRYRANFSILPLTMTVENVIVTFSSNFAIFICCWELSALKIYQWLSYFQGKLKINLNNPWILLDIRHMAIKNIYTVPFKITLKSKNQDDNFIVQKSCFDNLVQLVANAKRSSFSLKYFSITLTEIFEKSCTRI